jgi:hypothetical protein
MRGRLNAEADRSSIYLCSHRVTVNVQQVFKGRPGTVISLETEDSAAGCGQFFELNQSRSGEMGVA